MTEGFTSPRYPRHLQTMCRNRLLSPACPPPLPPSANDDVREFFFPYPAISGCAAAFFCHPDHAFVNPTPAVSKRRAGLSVRSTTPRRLSAAHESSSPHPHHLSSSGDIHHNHTLPFKNSKSFQYLILNITHRFATAGWLS